MPVIFLTASGLEEDVVSAIKLGAVNYLKKPFLSSAFVINSTHMMCRSGRISKRIRVLCDALRLHPVLALKKSRMAVTRMEMGGFPRVAKRHVRRCL